MVYRRSGVRFQAKATTQACKGELHCEDRQPVDVLKAAAGAPYQKITCGTPKVPCRILRHCGILQKNYANGGQGAIVRCSRGSERDPIKNTAKVRRGGSFATHTVPA